MSKLIVFDFDGTLVDSIPVYWYAIQAYSKENNMQLPCLEAWRHGYHAPGKVDFKWGIPIEEQEKHFLNVVYSAHDRMIEGNPYYQAPAFERVQETLVALKQAGHTLAIVTAKEERAVLSNMKYLGIDGYFCGVRHHDDVARRGYRVKPAPDKLLCVMRELGFAPQDTIMVGDTHMDIEMGHNAGVETVAVTWGAHDLETLRKSNPHHMLEKDMSELLSIVNPASDQKRIVDCVK